MNKSIKVFHWLPRIICIAAIFFVAVYSISSFASEHSGQNMGGFLIHLIPTIVLILLLIAAWKWELTGGIIFILIGMAMSPLIFADIYKLNETVGKSLSVVMTLFIPFIIVGALFILSFYKKKRDLNTGTDTNELSDA